MKRAILAPADLGGAALGELKDWLAITTDGEDASLTALLAAALEACEAFTGTMPIAQTVEEILPVRRDWQPLATRPVQAVTGMDGIPAEGPRFALVADAFEIDIDADGTGRIRVARPGAAGRVAVRSLAGLAPGWGSLPDGLRHGILRLAAHLYRERDGAAWDMLPAAITALWRPWRRMRLA